MIESFRSLFAPPRHFILIVAAIWIGLVLAEKRTQKHGISREQLNNILFYGLFGFIIGGRVLYTLEYISSFAQSPLNIFSLNPDLFDPSSGLLIAIFVGLIYGKRQKISLWGALDSLTPVFALLAIGLSLSHLAAGTAFGSPTNAAWGIDLWNATRHPTQIYELVTSLLIFGWLWFQKADSPPGISFLTFIAMTAGSRLFLEAFRGDSTLIFGEYRLAQIAAWIILAAALFTGESIKNKPNAG